MVLMRLQVTIPMDDNLPENFATNTWYFSVPEGLAELEGISDEVDDLYNNFSTHLSNLITPGLWLHRWYRMDDPKPRVPFLTLDERGPGGTGTNAAPPELALCMSFRGQQASGFPAGRTRGRLYMGPLAQSTIDTNGRPSSNAVTALKNGARNLREASGAAAWTWVVFSPTERQSGRPGIFDVQTGWVDNEFDIQRRRGRRSTSREVF